MKQFITGNDTVWSMSFVKHSDFLSLPEIKKAGDIKRAGLKAYPAAVPGAFELDLQAAGLVDEPFYAKNILSLHEYEDCHVWYSTVFDAKRPDRQDAFLVFEGLDTYADIYLNGKHLASTDNMLIEHKIPLAELKDGKNELLIHISPACLKARDYDYAQQYTGLKYNYEGIFVRKAPHMYGWDIMPRAVCAGLWRPAYLLFQPKERIEELYVKTGSVNGEGGDAWLRVFYNVHTDRSHEGLSIRLTGECGGSSFSAEGKLFFTAGHFGLNVGDARLWWPAGRGEQSLYNFRAVLLRDGEEVHSLEQSVGIRTVELLRTDVTDENGSGEFCFKVNGEKVFVKGSNWVPADAFHCRDAGRIPEMLELVKDIGCNMLRCWGGNVYENEIFYDWCDRNGILIWQDFALACGIYPQDEEFQKRLEIEASAVVKRLRSHPCVALWAGDNECDQAYYWTGAGDPNQNVLTRKVLPSVTSRHDGSRPYLPSSPYVSPAACEKGMQYIPEDHMWGPRDYFKSKYYRSGLCHFASEIGYHGCPNVSSIKRFISPEALWPYESNDEWMVHAAAPKLEDAGPYNYRIGLMANQVKALFGDIPDTLERFAAASQISQAEAKKFFIESFRNVKWRRTGIIWWNIIDGWPQFSDAVVDYYYGKKLAYEYIKTVQQPVCIMVKEPQDGLLEVVASNDTRSDSEISYTVEDADTGEVLLSGKACAKADSVTRLGYIPFAEGERRFMLIGWEGQSEGRNHYLSGYPEFDLDTYLGWMEKAGYKINP